MHIFLYKLSYSSSNKNIQITFIKLFNNITTTLKYGIKLFLVKKIAVIKSNTKAIVVDINEININLRYLCIENLYCEFILSIVLISTVVLFLFCNRVLEILKLLLLISTVLILQSFFLNDNININVIHVIVNDASNIVTVISPIDNLNFSERSYNDNNPTSQKLLIFISL